MFEHQAHNESLVPVKSISVVGYDSCLILFCVALGLDQAPEPHRPQFVFLRPYARLKISVNFVLVSHTKVNFNCSSEKNDSAISR